MIKTLLSILALVAVISLLLWGFTIWNTQFSPQMNCADIGGNWDHKKNVCSIISQCLDKGGCYALPTGALPKNQPFCLFGKDMAQEACYDSAWLREYLNP